MLASLAAIVQFQQDQFSYLFQASVNNPFGTPGDPVASLKNDPRFTSITSIPTPAAPPVIRAQGMERSP